MKHLAKIFTLLLVAALLVTGIVLTVSADEPAAESTEPSFSGVLAESITLDENTVSELTAEGYVALEFENEAAFKAAKESGIDALKAAGVTSFAHPSGATQTYVYLLADASCALVLPGAGTEWVLNLGGNNLTYTAGAGAYWGKGTVNITYVNGAISDTANIGHALTRWCSGTINIAYVDIEVTGITSYMQKPEGSGSVVNIYCEDSTLNLGGRALINMGQSGTNTCTYTAIFKNTEIVGTLALTRYNTTDITPATNPSIYIGEGCKIDLPAITAGSSNSFTPDVTVVEGVRVTATVANALLSLGCTFPEGASFIDTVDGTTYPVEVQTVKAPDSISVTAGGDLASAGYSYVVYADEAAFLSDVDNGVIDGLNAEGVSVLTGNSTGAFPTSGYVCFLTSYTYSEIFDAVGVLSFNLNGKTFTQGLPAKSATSATQTGVWNIFNGTFVDNFSYNYPTNRIMAYSVLNVKDATLNIKQGWENNGTCFWLNAGTVANFENVTVNHTGKQTSALRVAGAGVTVNLKGVTYSDTATHTTYSSGSFSANGAYYGFIAVTDGSLTLNVDKNTVVTAGYLVNKDADSRSVTLNVELGFRMAYPDFTNGYAMEEADREAKSWNVITNLNYVENGEVVTDENIKFALDNGLYLLQRPGSVIFYDENGEVLSAVDKLYTDTVVTVPTLTDSTFALVGEKYVLSGEFWALTQGGEAVQLPAAFEIGVAHEYHKVVTSVDAAIVVFDSEGGTAVAAFADAVLNKDMVAEFPAGAYVLVCADITMDYGELAEKTIDNYNGSLTIDLGGYTLTQVNYGAGVGMAWGTPAAGNTVVIKNGTVNVSIADSITSQGGIATLISAKGAGTLKFHKVTINTAGQLGSLDAGSVIFELCNIKQKFANSLAFILGNGAAADTEIDLQLLGTNLSVESKSGHMLARLYLGNYKKVVNVTISDYDGVYSYFNSARFFGFYQIDKLQADTKLNVVIENAYASSYNNMIDGGAASGFKWYNAETGAYENNTDLNYQNLNFTFSNFLYSRTDLFDYTARPGHTILETANVNIKKTVTIYNTDTGKSYVPTGFILPPADLGIKANLTLFSDIYLNLYVPADFAADQIIYGGSVIFDKALADTYDVVDGMYRVVIEGVAPNAAAQSIELGFKFLETIEIKGAGENNDVLNMNYTLTAKYSIVKYVSDVIATEDTAVVSEAAKNNAKALAAYVKAAYDFFGGESDETVLAQLEALVTADVLEYVNGFTASDDANDFENVNVVAVFTSEAVTKLSLTFEDGVAWTVTNGSFTESGTGGTCEVNLRAYTLCDEITITAGGESATFSLGEYVATRIANGATGNELAALQALYAYGMTAQAFKPAN